MLDSGGEGAELEDCVEVWVSGVEGMRCLERRGLLGVDAGRLERDTWVLYDAGAIGMV